MSTAVRTAHDAVEPVGSHMQEQANGYKPGTAIEQADDIDSNSPIAMERVKAYTTTAGIEYGSGQQMIEVDQHSKQQDDICLHPMLFIIPPRYEHGEYEVKKIMDNLLHTGPQN